MINRTEVETFSTHESDGPNQSSTFLENPRGEPLTWGATPLQPIGEVITAQRKTEEQLDSLFTKQIPAGVPDQLADYIHDVSTMRSAHRVLKNMDSFAYRHKLDFDNVDVDTMGMYTRALSGNASPAELIHVHHIFGLPSVELASLTHPYGKRIEMLQPMRSAINQSIDMHKGFLNHSVRPELEVLMCNDIYDPACVNSILMKRETHVGTVVAHSADLGIFESVIVERSTFVLRIDKESGFDPHLAAAIRDIPYGEHWASRVRRAGKLDKVVPELLESDSHEQAIPISTTTLAYSNELINQLLTSEHMHSRQREIVASQATERVVQSPQLKKSLMFTVGIPDKVIDSLNQDD